MRISFIIDSRDASTWVSSSASGCRPVDRQVGGIWADQHRRRWSRETFTSRGGIAAIRRLASASSAPTERVSTSAASIRRRRLHRGGARLFQVCRHPAHLPVDKLTARCRLPRRSTSSSGHRSAWSAAALLQAVALLPEQVDVVRIIRRSLRRGLLKAAAAASATCAASPAFLVCAPMENWYGLDARHFQRPAKLAPPQTGRIHRHGARHRGQLMERPIRMSAPVFT